MHIPATANIGISHTNAVPRAAQPKRDNDGDFDNGAPDTKPAPVQTAAGRVNLTA